MPQSHRASRRFLPLAALAVLFAGCTMCPNPFDYAGPVPNGSAPQNDFQARSNGVIPIGTAPKPWPPLVQREADAKEPTVAAAAPQGEPTPVWKALGDTGVKQVAGELTADPVAD
jgi:hypothetical protein